jgi:hypothetical protein
MTRLSTIAPSPVPATPAVGGSPPQAGPIPSATTMVLTAEAVAIAAFMNAAPANRANRGARVVIMVRNVRNSDRSDEG